MTTEDIIIHIFCLVDDEMKDMPKHGQAKLYPSELVTIGILFALKGRLFSRLLSLAQARLCRSVCRVARSHSAAVLAQNPPGLE